MISIDLYATNAQIELNHWFKIASEFEFSGMKEGCLYARTMVIAGAEPDPMLNVNQLMSDLTQVDQ